MPGTTNPKEIVPGIIILRKVIKLPLILILIGGVATGIMIGGFLFLYVPPKYILLYFGIHI